MTSPLAKLPSTARTPTAIVHLVAGDLVRLDGSSRIDLASLRGQSLLVVSAIGDPTAFHSQLEAVGARVTGAPFRDHHQFTPGEVASLVSQAAKHDRVVCTLKDAVKLAALWPASTPLWYVSQRVEVERGSDLLNDVVFRMLAARVASTTSGLPGSPGPAA